ncbi:MAG TPA: UbiA family prenyltransferase [Methanocella sp.]|nr:UbiA family prenyltransferase [Methanocella sp.]
MLKKLKAYRDLTRLENGLIFAMSFVVSLIIARPDGSNMIYVALAGIIASITAEMGAFALNDYFDVEVDRKNNRTDRPIVRGEVSKSEAMAVTVAGFAVSIIAGTLMGNIGALAVIIALIIFSIFYDYRLKEYGIWGNIYIAFTMAAPFLFTSMLFNGSNVLNLLSIIAFLVGLGREIMKGIMDMEGDELRDVKTVARVHGERAAKYVAVSLYVLALLLAPVPFFVSLDPTYYHNPIYAVLTVLSGLTLLQVCASMLRNHERKTISRARKTTMAAMVLALLAFLLPTIL